MQMSERSHSAVEAISPLIKRVQQSIKDGRSLQQRVRYKAKRIMISPAPPNTLQCEPALTSSHMSAEVTPAEYQDYVPQVCQLFLIYLKEIVLFLFFPILLSLDVGLSSSLQDEVLSNVDEGPSKFKNVKFILICAFCILQSHK